METGRGCKSETGKERVGKSEVENRRGCGSEAETEKKGWRYEAGTERGVEERDADRDGVEGR